MCVVCVVCIFMYFIGTLSATFDGDVYVSVPVCTACMLCVCAFASLCLCADVNVNPHIMSGTDGICVCWGGGRGSSPKYNWCGLDYGVAFPLL